jgi:hypothetical protein
MREITIATIILLLLPSCTCLVKNREACNNERYSPVAIRLSDFSSQIIYYFQNRKQVIPSDFDGKQFVMILKQLPPDQVNRKDLDSIVSHFQVDAHSINGGFSVMLCKGDQKIMEDFASPHSSECTFNLNQVEIRSWNKSVQCSFEASWQQYCIKH